MWGFGSAQRERETMNSSSSGSAPQQQLETTQFLLLTSPSRLISSNTLAISGEAPTLKGKKKKSNVIISEISKKHKRRTKTLEKIIVSS